MSKHLDGVLKKYGIDNEVFNVLLDDYPDHYKRALSNWISKIDTCYSDLNKYHNEMKSEVNEIKSKIEEYQSEQESYAINLDISPDDSELVESHKTLSKGIVEDYKRLMDAYLTDYSQMEEIINKETQLYKEWIEKIVDDVMSGGERLPDDYNMDTK